MLMTREVNVKAKKGKNCHLNVFLAIVISGGAGTYDDLEPVLLWSPKRQCRLPNLPFTSEFVDWLGHTINWIDNSLV